MTSPALPPADSQFSAPWHAQAFALCLALYEAGIFEWSEFSDALGVELDVGVGLGRLHVDPRLHVLQLGERVGQTWLGLGLGLGLGLRFG